MSETDGTAAPSAAQSPNGANRTCAAGLGLLEHAIHCFTDPRADCDVPRGEPCYLRRPENILAVMVGFEVAAQLGQWPGGGERLNEMIARWRAEPEQSAANLRELIARPVPTSPETDDRPWPGFYL